MQRMTALSPNREFFVLYSVAQNCYYWHMTTDVFEKGAAAYRAGNKGEAARRWQVGAEHGDVECQWPFGMMRLMGVGIEQDLTEGDRWLGRAAETKAIGGDPERCYELASIHATGILDGTKAAENDVRFSVDEKKARYWFNVAERYGSLRATIWRR